MFDELALLRESLNLQRLLSHYSKAAEADGEPWQDRLMALAGVESRELVKLHGLLIAFGWLEQNTGNSPAGAPGRLPSCYRVTSAGARARKAVHSWNGQGQSEVIEGGASGTAEAAEPKSRKVGMDKTAWPKKAPAGDAVVTEVGIIKELPSLA